MLMQRSCLTMAVVPRISRATVSKRGTGEWVRVGRIREFRLERRLWLLSEHWRWLLRVSDMMRNVKGLMKDSLDRAQVYDSPLTHRHFIHFVYWSYYYYSRWVGILLSVGIHRDVQVDGTVGHRDGTDTSDYIVIYLATKNCNNWLWPRMVD